MMLYRLKRHAVRLGEGMQVAPHVAAARRLAERVVEERLQRVGTAARSSIALTGPIAAADIEIER